MLVLRLRRAGIIRNSICFCLRSDGGDCNCNGYSINQGNFEVMAIGMLSKSDAEKYLKMYGKEHFFLEVFNEYRGSIYLKLMTSKGPRTIGRLPKSVFKWFEFEKTIEQPGFINMTWYKFKLEKNGKAG